MKLRTQNFLAFLPVFFGTVLIMNTAEYLTEWQELLWGKQNEAASFAVSIAEYLTPSSLAALSHPVDATPESSHFTRSLDRIFASGLIRYLAIIGSDGTSLLWSHGQSLIPDNKRPLPEFHQELQTLLVHESQLSMPEDSAILRTFWQEEDHVPEDALMALAPVSNGAGELAAMVLVELDLKNLAAYSKDLIRHVAIIGILVMTIGGIIIWILSRIVQQPIRRFTKALRSVSDREARRWIEGTFILEFNNLGNTYNTMVSVLDEADQRISRGLLQSEEFRSRAELEEEFIKEYWPPIKRSRGTSVAKGAMVGHSPASFFLVEASPVGLCALVCRLAIRRGTEHLLDSSCAAALIRQDVSLGNVASAMERVVDVYRVDIARAVCLDPDGNTYTRWDYERRQGKVDRVVERLEKGSTLVLHTFSDNKARRIEIFANRFGDVAVDRLMEEMITSLDAPAEGALILIQP